MEKNKEKKEIKISLWTFYVLIASLVVLLATTVSGWLLIAKQNNEPQKELVRVSVIERQK